MICRRSNVLNIAHIRGKDGTVQSLESHLIGTAKLSASFASELGLENTGHLIGLLHDIGKASEDFNNYISGNSKKKRGEIDHSTAGAQYLYLKEQPLNAESATKIIASEIMEMAIASHHSGLIDCISLDGCSKYKERVLKGNSLTHYNECINRIDQKIIDEIESLYEMSISELSEIVETILKTSKNIKDGGFMRIGLLTRDILSCLIDADRLDTISFQKDSTYSAPLIDWSMLNDRFEAYLSDFPSNSDISRIRKEISDECLSASNRNKGIFTLTVPTGGGKTLSSFRFAINHLKNHGMKRIIFVVPYLTIIEQNASVIKNILNTHPGDDFITECHSNIDVEECAEESVEIFDAGTDSWDGPIIFTSMVQFLETLFSAGTKRIRRMHNLSNAVIVFDEIQSLPIKTTYMFNESISYLTKYCGSSVVLCTATQPLLGGNIDYRLELSPDSEIIENVEGLFNSLKRTRISLINPNSPWSANDIASAACAKLESADSVLVIVNTKRMAKEVYEFVKGSASENTDIYHLSTNMCPVHRKKVLRKVISNLHKKKTICISTQLIEAGVDVDFDVVFRSLAGLDSIAQAAGRCNRNAEHEIGEVLVVDAKENLGTLTDIKIGCECARSTIHHHSDDLISPSAIREYFSIYFYNRTRDMSYTTDNTEATLFNMLSKNNAGTRAYKSRNGKIDIGLPQAFKTANDEFKVIDSYDSIIIPYDEISREAISRLCDMKSTDIFDLMKTLQHYSINVMNLDRLLKNGMVYEIPGSGIFCLKDGYYDEECGLRNEPKMNTMIF